MGEVLFMAFCATFVIALGVGALALFIFGVNCLVETGQIWLGVGSMFLSLFITLVLIISWAVVEEKG